MRPGGLHLARIAAAGQIARQRAGHRFRRGRHADAAGRCAGARHHRLAGRAPTGRRLHADDGLRRRAVRRAAGLTRGRECTTHHGSLAQLAALDPSARILDNRIFVEDGALVSSAGITAGIDLALHMVSRHCGPRIACEVAREMLVYQRRAGTDSALSPWLEHRSHLHPGVHKVQDAVVRNPAAPWSAQSLAQEAHTSARHLTRLFRLHAGCTPMDYLYQIRVALARDLLRETRLDLERVAEKAGFGSAQHMRRVWRRFEPRTPGMARQQLAA